LFPSASIAEGLRHDFSSASHRLLRLRVFHPLLAVVTGGLLLVVAARALSDPKVTPAAARLARWLRLLVVAQLAIGVTNFGLLAPIWLQLLHLLVADVLWLTLVLLGSAWGLARAEASGTSGLETPELSRFGGLRQLRV
jgi:heme A synthase